MANSNDKIIMTNGKTTKKQEVQKMTENLVGICECGLQASM